MKTQKDIFLKSEGDEWYQRNQDAIKKRLENDIIIKSLESLNINPQNVLEVGCADGYRLNEIHSKFQSNCYGIEPSLKAVESGNKKYPKINLVQADASNMKFDKNSFDLIIFGFSLYLCDRDDLFKIGYLADKFLADNGHIVIYDFYSKINFQNKYSHKEGLFSYKMDNSKIFNWHPSYMIIFERLFNADGENWNNNNLNDVTKLSFLKKIKSKSFIDNPYE